LFSLTGILTSGGWDLASVLYWHASNLHDPEGAMAVSITAAGGRSLPMLANFSCSETNGIHFVGPRQKTC
jgi:hypothetical protein